MASPEIPTDNARKAKVTGGKDAQPGQFKSQVALILSTAPQEDPFSGVFCGGTLIGWRWVLT
ncbi:MAG: trypsin-like serine protease, partial [Hyphomicrobium sp.]|nr:trypsin-like serine protease [Hyphomicrobium sp.]